MTNRKAKIMIPTCTAPMQIKSTIAAGNDLHRNNAHLAKAMVLIEVILVITLLALLTGLAGLTFSSAFGSSQFEKEAQGLIKTLQMAHNAAVETNRRYAVVIDTYEQAYMLREYATIQDLIDEPEIDKILKTAEFTENCFLDYIFFDDGVDSRDPELENSKFLFIAGRSGYQAGGKIVLLDQNENQHTIIVNKTLGIIELEEGDVEIFLPMNKEDVPF